MSWKSPKVEVRWVQSWPQVLAQGGEVILHWFLSQGGTGKLMDGKEIQTAAAGQESCLGTLEGAETGREGREGETTAASEEKGALKFGEHRNKGMCRTGGNSWDLLWHR